jgi:hypothetical protein
MVRLVSAVLIPGGVAAGWKPFSVMSDDELTWFLLTRRLK